jgi:hypothetical protein
MTISPLTISPGFCFYRRWDVVFFYLLKDVAIRHLKILNQSSEEEAQIGEQPYVCKIIAKKPIVPGLALCNSRQ